MLFRSLAALAGRGDAPPVPPAYEATDLNGIVQRPLDPHGRRASVLLFLWHECPISNSYAPEINRLCARYTNFAFYLVQIDPTLTPDAARKHAKDFNLRAPVLLDPHHRLVKIAQATVTPEAAVVAANGDVIYRGRIDDLYAALGQKRARATTHDLRDALDAILAGKPVPKATTKAIGCLIPNGDK